MKKTLLSLCLLLLTLTCAWSQQLTPYAHISGGAWPLRLRQEPYTNDYQALQGYAGLGAGAEIQLHKSLAFAPELGLDIHRLRYDYAYLGSPRDLQCNLAMYHLRVSPGLRLRLGDRWHIRAGLPFMFAAGATGRYTIRQFSNTQGYSVYASYEDRFGRIMSPLIVATELGVGHQLPLAERWALTARLSACYGWNSPVMQYASDAPHNPHIRRLSLEVGLARLPRRHD